MCAANVLIITGYGTNCAKECAYTATKAGANHVETAFFSDLKTGRVRLSDYNFLVFPGGFLDGDDLGAAQAAALRWQHVKTDKGITLLTQLMEFLAKGGLVLGICNGFQLLVKLGLLPGLTPEKPDRSVSLSLNDSAKFEDRWISLKVNPKSPCIFTKGLQMLEMPVRHGEGKLVTASQKVLDSLEKQHLIALQYAHPKTGSPTQEYPHNPNGSPLAIAGLTDPTGHILGLMPHPEAFNHKTNHPRWTRGASPVPGTVIMENAVCFLQKK